MPDKYNLVLSRKNEKLLSFLDAPLKNHLLEIIKQADWIEKTDSPIFGLFLEELKHRRNIQAQLEVHMGEVDTFMKLQRLLNSSTKILIDIMDRMGFSPRARKNIKSIIEHEPTKTDLDDLEMGIEI